MRDVITALRERASDPADVFCRVVAQGQETSFTSRETLGRSSAYANLYRDAGIDPGSPVVIILKHSPELYFAFLGAMLAGCTPSFMPFPSAKQEPNLYWSQHKAVFERIGVAAVVTYADNAPHIRAHCPGLRVFTPEDAVGLSRDWPAFTPEPEDIAFLQHSSGTTGLKKGVLLSYGAVTAQTERYIEELQLGTTDVIVSWLPLYHDMGLIACFMLPLAAGATVVSLDAFEWVAQPEMLFSSLEAHGGTHVWLPNFAFHHLCRAVRPGFEADLSRVKAFIDCSEPCRYETFELFVGAFARLGVRWDQCRVCYAMAETVFAVTQTPRGEPVRSLDVDEQALTEGHIEPASTGRPQRRIVSVGRPIRDVALQVIDPAGGLAPALSLGEVAVRAPFLFSGYHRDQDRTASKLRDGWYHTGDLGFICEGELYLLGRTDDLLIINGRNVFAHHVEFAINAEIPELKAGRCLALGVFSEQVGSQELLILAELDGRDIAGPGLSRRVKSVILNGFGVMPKEVRIVPAGWLAKTTSGKIARDLNLKKYLETNQAKAAADA